MKRKKDGESVSSMSLREKLDRELEKKGLNPLPEVKACSGSSGSWKNIMEKKIGGIKGDSKGK